MLTGDISNWILRRCNIYKENIVDERRLFYYIMTKKVPCNIYSRVCGFYRPVSQWNNGKREEYRDRKQYNKNEVENALSQMQQADDNN